MVIGTFCLTVGSGGSGPVRTVSKDLMLVGDAVGLSVGLPVGLMVGLTVGEMVGLPVGLMVGLATSFLG